MIHYISKDTLSLERLKAIIDNNEKLALPRKRPRL